MTLRRNLGRVGMMMLVVSSMGAVPTGSCARACGSGSRAAARGAGRSAGRLASHGGDAARLGGRGATLGDDLARLGGRGVPPRVPVAVPLHGGAGFGDDLAHLSASNLDGAVAALPELEGATSRMAVAPSRSGARVVERGGARRSFGRDYGRSVDQVKLSRQQHEELVDAFDAVQTIAEEAVGQIVDHAAGSDDAYDDAEDGADEGGLAAAPPSAAAAAGARRRLQLAGRVLDARLERILDAAQREELHALLGSSEVIAYRLGRERPIVRE